MERGKGDIAEALGHVASDYPDLSVGSYPFVQKGRFGVNVVVRGSDVDRLEAAMGALKTHFPEAAE